MCPSLGLGLHLTWILWIIKLLLRDLNLEVVLGKLYNLNGPILCFRSSFSWYSYSILMRYMSRARCSYSFLRYINLRHIDYNL
jgi:hypothetical protein